MTEVVEDDKGVDASDIERPAVVEDDKGVDEPDIERPAGDGRRLSESRGQGQKGSEESQQEGTAPPSVSFVLPGAENMPTPTPDDEGNNQCRFPFPFYDPTTKLLMRDPVVDPEGNSIENPVASGGDNSTSGVDDAPAGADDQPPSAVMYYPNRVLKAIIQREVELKCPSFVGSLRRIDDAVWQSWHKLVDRSLIGAGDMKPLPEGFYCPITAELMTDPVISPNGHTFERKAIEHWVRANGNNPISRDALSLKSLRRNNNLYELIQRELHKLESARHPSIRRWNETTEQTSRPDHDVRYDDEVDTPNALDSAAAGPNNNNMPTTHAEIAAIRRYEQDNQGRSFLLVLLFTVLVVTGVIPFGTAFLLLFWMIAICACLNAIQTRNSPT
jgi:hypothetical protein